MRIRAFAGRIIADSDEIAVHRAEVFPPFA
jgi:hypothetical protein